MLAHVSCNISIFCAYKCMWNSESTSFNYEETCSNIVKNSYTRYKISYILFILQKFYSFGENKNILIIKYTFFAEKENIIVYLSNQMMKRNWKILMRLRRNVLGDIRD